MKRTNCKDCNTLLDETNSIYQGVSRASRCRKCWNEYQKAWRETTNYSVKKKAYDLNRRYNITQEEYTRLNESQNGVCAICKEEYTTLSVDHNHDTGEVRGLLCVNCNTLIGLAKSNIVTLLSAVQYLNRV